MEASHAIDGLMAPSFHPTWVWLLGATPALYIYIYIYIRGCLNTILRVLGVPLRDCLCRQGPSFEVTTAVGHVLLMIKSPALP